MLENRIKLSALNAFMNCDFWNFGLISEVTIGILSSEAEAIVRCVIDPNEAKGLFSSRVILEIGNWTHLSIHESVSQEQFFVFYCVVFVRYL